MVFEDDQVTEEKFLRACNYAENRRTKNAAEVIIKIQGEVFDGSETFTYGTGLNLIEMFVEEQERMDVSEVREFIMQNGILDPRSVYVNFPGKMFINKAGEVLAVLGIFEGTCWYDNEAKDIELQFKIREEFENSEEAERYAESLVEHIEDQ